MRDYFLTRNTLQNLTYLKIENEDLSEYFNESLENLKTAENLENIELLQNFYTKINEGNGLAAAEYKVYRQK